ncbi:hypothetical protein BFP72_00735 [Reichenbachiella sp. 5M10]|uniref:DUF3302 domain-containing protein n=1 Tax=Reichenbachiella sp. 5M10 TaxID=1889772 RepID=UPI000C16000C|nr:DUF3302 domain-containing protein [Reichenbachiella sp. 5M10]PIB34058.1 hypothetical protein BFP72_00735 [Reichenbachiella sp. 5M10]
MDGLNILALCFMILIAITLVYVVIYIHDIPYQIAKKRNHPHQEAIHMAGWVSLILMHAIWPLLWIWAYLYTDDGSNLIPNKTQTDDLKKEIEELRREVESLKKK